MDLTNTCGGCIFASWFFHNSIRFKVNKVWLGDVVRHPLIVYRRFVPQINHQNSPVLFDLQVSEVLKAINGKIDSLTNQVDSLK